MPQKEDLNSNNKNKYNEMEGFDNDRLLAASSTDMTGLTPTPVLGIYKAHSYEDIVPYQAPLNPYPTFPVTDAPVGNANPRKFKEKFPNVISSSTKKK